MRKIELTQGQVALVDDADYALVSQFKWSALKASEKHCWYAVTNMWTERGRRSVRMHRIILGAAAGQVVDHVDGDGLNNQRSNLRLCTQADNVKNAQRFRKMASRFKGVTPSQGSRRNPWRAQIQHEKRKIPLGRFKSEEDAALAYNFAAAELFGEFARFNEAEQTWEGAF